MARTIGSVLKVKSPEYNGKLDMDEDIIHNDFIGVEIEYERAGRAGEIDADYWEIHEDGSLRDGGAELVFRRPLRSANASAALRNAEAALSRVSFSARTSVHVHVDVRDIAPSALMRYICLYYIFEELLFSYCGPQRVDNNFCISGAHARGVVDLIGGIDPKRVIKSLREMGTSEYRYASVNLDAVLKFGSLEFRGHRGTADYNQITNWINMLLCMKHYAVRNKNLVGVLATASGDGPLSVLEDCFTPKLRELLIESAQKPVHDMLVRGARLAQDILIARELRDSNNKIISDIERRMGEQEPAGEDAHVARPRGWPTRPLQWAVVDDIERVTLPTFQDEDEEERPRYTLHPVYTRGGFNPAGEARLSPEEAHELFVLADQAPGTTQDVLDVWHAGYVWAMEGRSPRGQWVPRDEFNQ